MNGWLAPPIEQVAITSSLTRYAQTANTIAGAAIAWPTSIPVAPTTADGVVLDPW